MTNKQAAQAARKIPFNPDEPLPTDVQDGLRRIVAKQVRRCQFRLAYPGVRGHMYGCALP